MKIAFISDVHVGNHRAHGGPVTAGVNRRCRDVLDALGRALKAAAEAGCEHMVVCGDLLDTARPEPQVIRAVQALLARAEAAWGLKAHLLLGNHEQVSTEEGDHSLGPLEPVAHVVASPLRLGLKSGKERAEVWMVPFRPGAAAEWLPVALGELAGQAGYLDCPRVLALHLGVRDERTPPWLRESRDSIDTVSLAVLMARHRLRAAFTGHWHEPRCWFLAGGEFGELSVTQLGALAPTGWDNPGAGYGQVAVFDTATQKQHSLWVPGPRFLDSAEEAERLLETDAGCRPYVRLRASPEEVPAAQASLEALAAQGVVGEVMPDAAEARAALRAAAGVARSGETLGEAVRAFVGKMPLAEGVDRADVLARVQGYLGVGA